MTTSAFTRGVTIMAVGFLLLNGVLLVMIDQIFIAQRNPKHALSDQRPDLMLDQIRRAAVGETVRKPIDEPDPRSVAPSSKAPPSEVIRPPSNPATTARPSTRANPNRSALHSVCIGSPPGPETNRCYNTIFSDRGPRCTYPV